MATETFEEREARYRRHQEQADAQHAAFNPEADRIAQAFHREKHMRGQARPWETMQPSYRQGVRETIAFTLRVASERK